MKSPALYLLEVFFCSGMLLAFYRLLLVRKVSFAACRRYLVAAMLLSAAIPALDIPLYPARTEADPLPLVASQAVPPAEEPFVAEAGQPAAVVRTTAPATDWGRVARIAVAALYLLTAAVSLAILAVRILGIRRLRRRSRITDCGAYAVAENPRVGTPFRFCGRYFWARVTKAAAARSWSATRRAMCATATPPNASRSELVRRLLVQSLCLDRRALAFGGAGVGGRPRRARCGVRPHGIQDDHFPSTLRL
ncbi:MAG: hypothetical protein ACLRQT_02610 [Alistipes sp.]